MSRVRRREWPERYRRLKRACVSLPVSLHSLSFIHLSVSHSRGDIALLRNADFHDRASNWSLERLWTGHHKGVVRSALLAERANVLLTGGEDANLLAWSCASLPKGEEGMVIDGSNSSPPVLAKRDHEGDVEMGDFSPENKKNTLLMTSKFC